MSNHKNRNRYNWNEIQEYYDKGHSQKAVISEFGVSNASIQKAIHRGDFKSRSISESNKLHRKRNPDFASSLWTPERRKQQSEAKKKLYKEHPEKHPNRKLSNNRSKMSYPEKVVYDWLTDNGYVFTHQKKIDKYFADFCIGSLVIEIDGDHFHRDDEYDKIRDGKLESLGFRVMRYPAKAILKYGPHIVMDSDFDKSILMEYIELRKERTCVVCGTTHYENRKTCSDDCLKQLSTKITNGYRKTKRPSKEELEELISSNSFLELGRKFGVSDNAVRKWCKSYGIDPKRQVELTKDELQKLVDSGMSRTSIAREIGVSGERIKSIAINYGIEIEPALRDYTDELKEEIKSRLLSGDKNVDIASELDVDHKYVSAIRCSMRKCGEID